MNVALKYTIWLGIWILFGLSIVGMSLASLLWTKKSREIIVQAWYRSTAVSEVADLGILTTALFDEQVARLLLNRDLVIGRLKTLAWSAVSSLVFLIGIAILEHNYTVTDAKFASDFKWSESPTAVLFLFACSTPGQWLLDYEFAKHFLAKFRQAKLLQKRASIWSCLLSGLVGLAKASIAILLWLFAFVFIASALKEFGILGEATHLEIVRWGKYFFINSVVTSVIFIGASFAGVMSFPPWAIVVLCVSSSASFVVVFLLASSIAATYNKLTLRFVSRACELLDSTNPMTLLSASLALFGLATGLMQAYTFTNP